MNTTQFEWPEVGVIIPTYNRPKVVVETIIRLHTYLRYCGKVSYHIGVDGDCDNTIQALGKMTPEILENVWTYPGPNKGLGANLNMLIKDAPSNIIFQLDDDHHLFESLNISIHVQHLIENPDAGWIRLMGIGGHSYQATLKGRYWYVDWNSYGDYSLYIPSMRPHLKHRGFHDYYGMYPEGLKLGETEETFCHQCRDGYNNRKEGDNPPFVLIPLNSNSETAWAHVGESWQGKGL